MSTNTFTQIRISLFVDKVDNLDVYASLNERQCLIQVWKDN